MTEIRKGSTWVLTNALPWQLYPEGSVATVSRALDGIVGYQYTHGANGVMPALEFSRAFRPSVKGGKA